MQMPQVLYYASSPAVGYVPDLSRMKAGVSRIEFEADSVREVSALRSVSTLLLMRLPSVSAYCSEPIALHGRGTGAQAEPRQKTM